MFWRVLLDSNFILLLKTKMAATWIFLSVWRDTVAVFSYLQYLGLHSIHATFLSFYFLEMPSVMFLFLSAVQPHLIWSLVTVFYYYWLTLNSPPFCFAKLWALVLSLGIRATRFLINPCAPLLQNLFPLPVYLAAAWEVSGTKLKHFNSPKCLVHLLNLVWVFNRFFPPFFPPHY